MGRAGDLQYTPRYAACHGGAKRVPNLARVRQLWHARAQNGETGARIGFIMEA
jgi:hypothetical protein